MDQEDILTVDMIGLKAKSKRDVLDATHRCSDLSPSTQRDKLSLYKAILAKKKK